MLATMRGVNPRFTMRRIFVCRGASMLIIDPKMSRNISGKSGMFVPSPETNAPGLRLACITSAYRVSDQ